MNMRVYLGGNISQSEETYLWRDKVEELVADQPQIIPINPCASKYNQVMREVNKGRALTDEEGQLYTKEAQQATRGLLPVKDYALLKTCDINLVNLTINTPGRPMIGTVFEMAWCKDVFKIPCIGITGGPDFESPYTEHPFIKYALEAEVATVEEAIELIAYTYVYT